MSATASLRGRIVQGYRRLPASSWPRRAVRGVVRRLGRLDDRLTLRYYPDLPALSTLVPFPHDGRHVELEVGVRSVEGFLADVGLSSIDVVKLDIEGMELPVVEGLASLLADHAIGLVQFEYGQANILTRAPLHAYADIARSAGYALGEVCPDGVVFVPYTFDAEDHRPRNMVLCRPDLVMAVAVP